MFFLACSSNSLLAVALGSKGLVDASPRRKKSHSSHPPVSKQTPIQQWPQTTLAKGKMLLYYVDAVVVER